MGGEQSKIDATKVVAPATHCHFSMKILIKGDNNTGKTSLFNRLQRKRFIEEHQMTPQSVSTTIEWEFPMSGFRVKIELWDVVEAAKKKLQQAAPLKLKAEPANNQNSDFYNSDSAGNLDPETQRLIENTNAVIFMVNPSKKHTLDYAKRVIPQLPPELDVLIVINYKDQEDDKRAFSLNDVMILATELGENVKYCEASMLNSFGIKAIKSFLNIPYVKAERIFLEEKLLQNEKNLDSSEENYAQTFKEQDYKFYKEWFQKTMKERMDVQNKRTPSPTQAKGVPLRNSTTPARVPSSDPKSAPKPAQAPPAKPVTSSAPENTGFFSKLKSMVSTTEGAPKKSVNDNKDIEELKKMAKSAKEGHSEQINIDEFDPSSVTGEKDSYDSFFDDEDEKPKGKPQTKAPAKPVVKAPPKIESDSEEEFNPLVTADRDDIDSDLENESSSILSHFSISNDKPKVDHVPKPKKVKPPKPQPVPQNNDFSDEDIPQPANNKNNNNINYNNNIKSQPTIDSDEDDFGGNALVAPDDDDIEDDFFDEPKQPPKPVVNQKKSDHKDKFEQKKDKNQKKNPVVSSNFDEDDDFAVDDGIDDSWLSDTPSDPKKAQVKKHVEKPVAKSVKSKELDDFFDDNDQGSGFDANSFYTPSSTSSSDSYRPMGEEKKRERKHRSDRERGNRESRDRHKERGDRDRGDRRDREKRKPQEPSSTKPQGTKNPFML